MDKDYSSNDSVTNVKGLICVKYFLSRVAVKNKPLYEEEKLSCCFTVSVEGHDTSLQADDISAIYSSHFGSCGDVFSVVIPRDCVRGVVERCGFIYFQDEGAQEKALALSGSNMGGWNVVVNVLPKKISPDQLSDARKPDQCGFYVSGYPTSLPVDDVKSALSKLFSSCGEIRFLNIYEDRCQPGHLNSLSVEGALEKAAELDGSDMGGWSVAVKILNRHYGFGVKCG